MGGVALPGPLPSVKIKQNEYHVIFRQNDVPTQYPKTICHCDTQSFTTNLRADRDDLRMSGEEINPILNSAALKLTMYDTGQTKYYRNWG